MKTYIVLVHNESNVDIVRERIQQLGDYYVFFEKEFVIETEINSALEVFEQIERGEQFDVVVFEVQTVTKESYWGFANRDLWKWLKDRQN